MSDEASLIAAQHESRRRFLELVAEIRPELHRYAARMVGSITDGEDVVQDTLACAYYALPEMETMPPLRPWLFRIAHHRALDHLKRYDVRMREPLNTAEQRTDDASPDPDEALAREQATRAAITHFVDLPPAPRSAVILKDVLGHSLEEIAAMLDLTLPAVKAALHRGRTRLRAPRSEPPAPSVTSPLIVRYVDLFNARDWDGVRTLLAEDVRLDLVSRVQRAGKRNVGNYFSNYDQLDDWYLVPALLDGREMIAVYRDAGKERATYFIELEVSDSLILNIRDFRYVPYVAHEADVRLLQTNGSVDATRKFGRI
jgi:RNA polymerase sigma-70 factor (ECF subfamily)